MPTRRGSLTAARLVAVEHAPYLAHALFSTQPVAAEGLGTFAVDRGWRLYVDPVTLVDWGPALAGGVLVHEIGHLVRAHAERADALGADYDHQRWNFATDAAINDDLLAAGVPLARWRRHAGHAGARRGRHRRGVLRGAGPAGGIETRLDDARGRSAAAPVRVTRPAPWELPADDPAAPVGGAG